MSDRPYSRMFYRPNEDLEASIHDGLVAERVINELWGVATSSDDFYEKLMVIELRVLRVFDNAKAPDTQLHTDNYIVGARGDLDSLAYYVESRFGYKGYIVHEYDLPEEIQRLKVQYAEVVAQQVRLYLVREVLRTFREEGDIWFDAGSTTWTVRQGKIDEYRARRARAGRTQPRRVKIDLRQFHGRNRGQSETRGVPEGTSIGPTRSKAVLIG